MTEKLRRFYFEGREYWESTASKKRFSDKNLKVDIVENGIVLPVRKRDDDICEGGVCDKDFNFIAGYSRSEPTKNHKVAKGVDVLTAYVVDKKEITDEDVIFGGVLFGHFGNFLLESVNRLWYVTPPPHTPPPRVHKKQGYDKW